MSDRPETGAMQFGDDWPGLYIRGDNALGYMMALDAVLQSVTNQHTVPMMQVKGLLRLLGGVDDRVGTDDRDKPIQRLKPLNDCKATPEEEEKEEQP